MKRNRNKLVVLVCLIVFIGLFVLTISDHNYYRDIIKNDILNITKLISTNIYTEIQMELIKPVFVSLTMANDEFLRDWVVKGSECDVCAITGYLNAIKDKYGYDSVFYVSDITKNYYHNDGILKQISTRDAHDVWYYRLINENVDYGLDVDTDQAAGNDLTFFVNCRMKDDSRLLGVTGVGVKMSRIREILKSYNDSLQVNCYLVSPDGTIQIHADENYIENYNIFSNEKIHAIRDEVLNEKGQPKVFELGGKYDGEYFISYYIKDLDWYLIVEKDTIILRDSLKNQLIRESIGFLTAFLVLAFISSKVINIYQDKSERLASTDMLTGLCNRAMFDRQLDKSISDASKGGADFTVALIDVDDLKAVNDTHGHVTGDKVIKAAADYLKELICADTLARWGGDEFAAIIPGAAGDAYKRIKQALKSSSHDLLTAYHVTLSIGLVGFEALDTPEAIIQRADSALYTAKKNGKNMVCKK